MTSPRRKLMEFWSDGVDIWKQLYPDLVREMPTTEFFLLREVSPEYDNAVEKMVEALKFYRHHINAAFGLSSDHNDYARILNDRGKMAREALAAYEKATGK